MPETHFNVKALEHFFRKKLEILRGSLYQVEAVPHADTSGPTKPPIAPLPRDSIFVLESYSIFLHSIFCAKRNGRPWVL